MERFEFNKDSLEKAFSYLLSEKYGREISVTLTEKKDEDAKAAG